jgi:hypothetical protein
MIPKNLNDWNFELIKKLVNQGWFETDTFDIKEDIPHKNDISRKQRLEKSICAFANTYGGFLLFGIKDDKSLPAEKRIIGIEPKRDFPREIGDKTKNIEPMIYYNFKNPPIKIPFNNNVIHILEIPKSPKRPHMTSTREFYYRTNRGNIEMSYQQIKESFIEEERRMEKLKLLFNELIKNKLHIKEMIVPINEIKKGTPLGFLDPNVLQILLLDADYIIKDKTIIKKFAILTENLRIMSQFFLMAQMKLSSGNVSKKNIKKLNEAFNIEAQKLEILIDELLQILKKQYGFDESISPLIDNNRIK